VVRRNDQINLFDCLPHSKNDSETSFGMNKIMIAGV
jgi:hypothetical protein